MPNHLAQPSFSPHRKWRIGLHVVLLTLLVLAVVAMINCLSQDYFLRFHLSTRTQVHLSSRTVNFIKSITNQVRVTIYYDKKDPYYSMIADLLAEYRSVQPKITVQTVDYLRDPAAAQKIKMESKLVSGSEKNLVIFDCAGKIPKVIYGDTLSQYELDPLDPLPGEKQMRVRRKPTNFMGEMLFTGALLDVTSPKPLNAYFLEGHGEHAIDSADGLNGYQKFATNLQQNCIQVQSLSLGGTNSVPADCHLLVIAGPRTVLPGAELDKIEQYLAQGGRLLAMFRSESINRKTGLEKLLASKYGVFVGTNIVEDPEHSAQSGAEVVISAFSKHPLVNPMLGTGLVLIRPRTISNLNLRAQATEALHVEEIAFTGENAFLPGGENSRQRYPVMVAVEKGAVKGVFTERGITRIVVVGDSLFLANDQIVDMGANDEFASCAANWLLDRSQLLEGVGPQPIKEYRLVMSRGQLQSAQLILLGGLPGGVLFLGTLVWLRRRR